METFKKRGVREKVKVEDRWKEAGKGPVGAKRVDFNEGDEEKPDYRCRLAAKEIENDKREALSAATLR